MEQIEKALYIVATPIGNLADLSYRAVYILKSVDLIAAEDTRTSSVLLRHYQIATKTESYHSYNIKTQTPRLIEKLKNGNSIALISDAGTPGISDPGYLLVKQCVENNIRVIPIPGANALLAALTASGLPIQNFVFEGFLPHKKGRKTRLEFLTHESRTIVFYESPHRIEKTVQQLKNVLGKRRCVIAREITKKFEEFIYSDLDELSEQLKQRKLKGEIVLIVEGKNK